MQTGQNSIAPENSLPQLGQVRLGSVLMDLTALQSQPQPAATRPSHRVVRNRPAQRLAYYGPVARVKRVFLDITTPAGPRFETKFAGTQTEALDP